MTGKFSASEKGQGIVEYVAVVIIFLFLAIFFLALIGPMFTPLDEFQSSARELSAELSLEKSHADEKHGKEAAEVREAIENASPDEINIWCKNNSLNGNPRIAVTCFLQDDGQYAVQVIEKEGGEDYEITAFKRSRLDGMKESWEQFRKYMESNFWKLSQ